MWLRKKPSAPHLEHILKLVILLIEVTLLGQDALVCQSEDNRLALNQLVGIVLDLRMTVCMRKCRQSRTEDEGGGERVAHVCQREDDRLALDQRSIRDALDLTQPSNML